jgi:cytochrome c1
MRRIVARQRGSSSWSTALLSIAVGWLASAPTHAAEPAYAIPGASIERGRIAIKAAGCAACHTVPGVRKALGNVGPPLTRIGDRTFIAGMLPNTPANLIRWIRFPQSVVPGNAMPDMNLSDSDARDIAAFLYTLR